MRTNNPINDYLAYCDEEEAFAHRPICEYCHENISDDTAYRVNGELICERCMDELKEDMTVYD